jgi:hypothetical protein
MIGGLAVAVAVSILVGDSQGQALAPMLRACRPGLVVDVLHGRPVAKVRAAAAAVPAATRAAASEVWIAAGGNDGAKPDHAEARRLIDLFPVGSVVWIAPPPATTIASLATARAVFGSSVGGVDHWQTSGKAAGREIGAGILRHAVEGYRGARWADPRDIVKPYPPQQDGIHLSGPTAKAVAARLCAGTASARGLGPWARLGIAALLAAATVAGIYKFRTSKG